MFAYTNIWFGDLFCGQELSVSLFRNVFLVSVLTCECVIGTEPVFEEGVEIWFRIVQKQIIVEF